MSLRAVLRRSDKLKWVAGFDKERLDLKSMFASGKPVLFRMHQSDVSSNDIVLNSLIASFVSRVGKQKSRLVVDGSRKLGGGVT